MNEVQKFFEMAVLDQIITAGESVVITRVKDSTVNITCKAVITSRDGSYDAEVGGVQYSVSGHALIQKNSVAGGEPQAGDRLTQESGEKWLLTNTISSSNDAAISCDLVRLA